MKFLCVECDEQMRLIGTKGPDRGSMSVLFKCGACGKQTAMLTNSMETQMVSSLGVSIGGRTTEAEPMEMLRSSLITDDEESHAPPAPSSGRTSHDASHAPAAEAGHSVETARSVEAGPEQGESTSKCPFTGMVNEAMSATELEWSDEARERMERIPVFVRPMVQRGIEDHARAKGLTRIDGDVLAAVRGEIGM